MTKKDLNFNMGKYRLDITNLRNIESQLKKRYITQVGILGDKDARKQIVENRKGERVKGRTESAEGNAEIGLVHEYGSLSRNIPPRSFLRMPLYLKLPGIISKLGQKVMDGLTKQNIKSVYGKLGVLAVQIVQVGFATHGFGKWAPNAPLTIARKSTKAGVKDSPLIDSGQLRKSIAFRVVAA